MRLFICFIVVIFGTAKTLIGQSQMIGFDSIFLAETKGFRLKKEERIKLMMEHKTIAIMPAAVSRFKGMFKPYPMDSLMQKSTAFRVQQMAYHTLQTTSRRDIPKIAVKPLIETNYILDSLYEAFPQSNVYDIIKALGVDAILIPDYQISVPRTGSYAAAGGLMIASALLGGRNYNRLPETTSTINYYVIDANMDLLFSINPNPEQFEIVDPASDRVPKVKIGNSELRKLPYVEHIYRIKNEKTRKIVNTISYTTLTIGILALLSIGYSMQ